MMLVVGDRGYGLKTWLMTRLANPRTPQEVRYNLKNACARSVIERVTLIPLDVLGCSWWNAVIQAREYLSDCFSMLCITKHRNVPAAYGPHAQP